MLARLPLRFEAAYNAGGVADYGVPWDHLHMH